MSKIETTAEMSVDRCMRKHDKYNMASTMVKVWRLVNEMRDKGLTIDMQKKWDDIQTEIAWG